MNINFIHWVKRHLGKSFTTMIYRSMGFLSDEKFISVVYKLRMGRKPDLKNPRTFTEKLQYLKLHDHNPVYTQMADKIGMRKYVEERIGSGHTVPILGIWDRFEDIIFSELPDQFVLKTSHDSGSYVICRDKTSFDFSQAKRIICSSLKRNYYKTTREWQYKNIVPKVYAESYLDEGKENLTDYKMFCFNGTPQFLYLEDEAADKPSQVIVGMDGKVIPFTMEDKKSDIIPDQIPQLEEMKTIAEKLAENVTFLRVDMYCINGIVYVGELTFYHYGGYTPFNPPEWDSKLGDMLEVKL